MDSIKTYGPYDYDPTHVCYAPDYAAQLIEEAAGKDIRFVSHRGETITALELVEAVWHMGFDAGRTRGREDEETDKMLDGDPW